MECSSMCSTAYEPPESLWRLVEESVSLEERGEIREILGDSLVDQSLELHVEAGALLEIWQNFKYETDDMTLLQPKILPEPPGMRDSLRNHIKMLVENICERSKITGRDSDILLSNHKNDIIEYALEGSSRGSSPIVVRSRPGSSPIIVQSRPSSSISSRSGRETPMRITPSSEDDRLSGLSSASDKVNSVRDRLNVLKIDEVVQELRGTLEDEVAQLISDIKFLQNCLEDERDFRCESEMSVYNLPSIQDLREERSKLEKMSATVPDAVDVIATIPRVRRRSMPGSPKRILKPLAPISPSLAGKGQIKSKPLPLKARHPHVTCNRSSEGIILQSGTLNNNRVSNIETVNSREMTANSNSSSSSSSPMQPSPPSSAISNSSSSSPMQPSPPSSATRPRGSPTSNRFRQRFRNVQRQNSSTS